MYKTEKTYRPNTKKLYEQHHGVTVPDDYAIHHVLPIRLGGTHDVSNLEALHKDDHILAHLKLYEEYGDVRDLCASYMLRGLPAEARKLAAAKGGVAGWVSNREKGVVSGFGAMTEGRRRDVAAIAGHIGGTKQRDLGIGIHVDGATRAEWAKLGAAAVAEQFADPTTQASRGKRGGPKNKGFRWCNDGVKEIKYTTAMQAVEPFEDYLIRTGYKVGKFPSADRGGKFYNNGISQWMFRHADHSETFEEFLEINQFIKGRLKK